MSWKNLFLTQDTGNTSNYNFIIQFWEDALEFIYIPIIQFPSLKSRLFLSKTGAKVKPLLSGEKMLMIPGYTQKVTTIYQVFFMCNECEILVLCPILMKSQSKAELLISEAQKCCRAARVTGSPGVEAGTGHCGFSPTNPFPAKILAWFSFVCLFSLLSSLTFFSFYGKSKRG